MPIFREYLTQNKIIFMNQLFFFLQSSSWWLSGELVEFSVKDSVDNVNAQMEAEYISPYIWTLSDYCLTAACSGESLARRTCCSGWPVNGSRMQWMMSMLKWKQKIYLWSILRRPLQMRLVIVVKCTKWNDQSPLFMNT